MRKLTNAMVALLFLAACQKTDAPVEPEQAELSADLKRSCAADDVLKAQIAADPALQDRINAIEALTRRAIQSGEVARTAAQQTITLPVVVHVLYNNADENITDAQIQSQIDVLNEDFNLRNRDVRQVPSVFSDRTANVGVKFELVQTVRKATRLQSWQVTDGMKFNNRGGSDAIDPANKLNIWVCDLAGYIGYAQFPGGKAETDGIVVDYLAFGRTGLLDDVYNLGRTATHEVGHWLNLRHIWGDANCGSDLVDDTPQHTTYNFGCPAFPHYNSCTNKEVEMTMNYMDYTDDACMYMFSNGQKDRMLAVFVPDGPRAGFLK